VAIVPLSIPSSAFLLSLPPRFSLSEVLSFRPSHLPSQLRKYIFSSLCHDVFQNAICQHVMTLRNSKELEKDIRRILEHKTNCMIIYKWINKNTERKKQKTFCVNVNNVTHQKWCSSLSFKEIRRIFSTHRFFIQL